MKTICNLMALLVVSASPVWAQRTGSVIETRPEATEVPVMVPGLSYTDSMDFSLADPVETVEVREAAQPEARLRFFPAENSGTGVFSVQPFLSRVTRMNPGDWALPLKKAAPSSRIIGPASSSDLRKWGIVSAGNETLKNGPSAAEADWSRFQVRYDGAGLFHSPALVPGRLSLKNFAQNPEPGSDLERLISRIENQGQTIKDPQTGETFKVLPPVVAQLPDGMEQFMVGLKGKTDEGGWFVKEGIVAVQGSRQVTEEKVSENSGRATETINQTVLSADLDGKVTRVQYADSSHVDVYTDEEISPDSAQAEFQSGLSKVQNTLGVESIKDLVEKLKAEGQLNPMVNPPVLVLETPPSEIPDLGEVTWVVAAEVNLEGKELVPKNLVLARVTANRSAAEDGKSNKEYAEEKTYQATLDGILQKVHRSTKDHSLVIHSGEEPGDESAQEAFLGIVYRVNNP